MNPQDPLTPENTPQTETPVAPMPPVDPVADLPSSDDVAALQQIDAIESESTDPSVAAAASLASAQNDTPQADTFATQSTASVPPAPVIIPEPADTTAPQATQPANNPITAPVAAPTATGPIQQPATQATPVAPAAFPQASEPKKSNKLVIIIAVAVLVVAGAVAGYFIWQSMQTKEDTIPQTTTETTAPEQTGGDLPGGGDGEVQVEETPAE